jgi:hypothetical protein
MIYVDSAPATGALDPDLEAVEKPLPSRYTATVGCARPLRARRSVRAIGRGEA